MFAVRIDPRPLIAALALASAGPVLAAPAKPAAAPARPAGAPAPEVIKAAQDTLMLIMSALKADNVPKELKGGLFGCLYQRPLGDISAATTKFMAADKRIDAKDPTQHLLAIARVCGITVTMTPNKPGAAPAPKTGN